MKHTRNIVTLFLALFVGLLGRLQAEGFLLPHYADGGGWATTFVVVNLSNADATGTLEVFDSSGHPAPLPFEIGRTAVVNLTLPPYSSAVVRTQDASRPIQTGFVKVETDGRVSGLAIFRSPSGLEASVLPVAPGNRFGLYVEARPGLDTGVALYREDPLPVNLRLHAADGTELETSSWDFSEKKISEVSYRALPQLVYPV